MLTLGLTGPSGSGKGVVASLFAAIGVPSIDTDRVYHDLLVPPSACLDELVACFGKEILHGDGTLDRPALAAIVFGENAGEKRSTLNRITHKYVLDAVRQKLGEYAAAGCVATLVDAPLLVESGFDKECDKVISVLADKETRITRIMTRDGLTREAAVARVASQQDDSFYRSHADFVLVNDGALEELKKQIPAILRACGGNV